MTAESCKAQSLLGSNPSTFSFSQMPRTKNAPPADRHPTLDREPTGDIVSNGEIFIDSSTIKLQGSAGVRCANYLERRGSSTASSMGNDTS